MGNKNNRGRREVGSQKTKRRFLNTTGRSEGAGVWVSVENKPARWFVFLARNGIEAKAGSLTGAGTGGVKDGITSCIAGTSTTGLSPKMVARKPCSHGIRNSISERYCEH